MPVHINDAERRRRLAVRHFLTPTSNPTDAVAFADALVAIHASDPTSVHLGAWARLPGLTIPEMEDALYETRSLVRVLGMRRTMFVVSTGVAPLLQHGCAGPLAPRERKRLIGLLEDSQITPDGAGWLADVEQRTLAALDGRGEATAAELTEDVPELGNKIEYAPDKSYGGTFGVSTRVLFLLAADGRIVRGRPRGTWVSSQYAWAPMSSWAPDAVRPIRRDEARVGLAERWVRSFGPAPVDDLAWWSGWGKRATAKALEALEVVEVALDGGQGVAHADDLEPTPEPEPWAALLPGLDTTVMGWKQRGWFLDDHASALFDRNGNAGPTVWWHGRIVGGWTQRPDGSIAHRLLKDIGADGVAAVESRASELQEWLGDRRFVARFRTPLDKELFDG